MDVTYKQEVGVGALVLVGLALFVALMFWLTDRRVGAKGFTVQVLFQNVAGLEQGDPVMVSGVKVGRVESVRLERSGRVSVTLTVARDVRPRLDAGAAIGSLDFLGSKYIDYSPGIREEPLPSRTVIVGSHKTELTDMAQGVAQRANELLGNATALVSEQLAVALHNTLVATQRGMNTLTAVGNGPLVSQATQTLAAAQKAMARLDSLLGSATGKRVDTLTANLSALTTRLSSASAALDTLLGRINRGEGTLGKVATDTMLYRNLNETLTALTALLTDLKERPGRYLTVKV